jgi:hypothetical protein
MTNTTTLSGSREYLFIVEVVNLNLRTIELQCTFWLLHYHFSNHPFTGNLRARRPSTRDEMLLAADRRVERRRAGGADTYWLEWVQPAREGCMGFIQPVQLAFWSTTIMLMLRRSLLSGPHVSTLSDNDVIVCKTGYYNKLIKSRMHQRLGRESLLFEKRSVGPMFHTSFL